MLKKIKRFEKISIQAARGAGNGKQGMNNEKPVMEKYLLGVR